MILFILIAAFSFLAQLVMPWWSMTIVAFILSYFIGKKGWQTFFSGFFGCGVVWLLESFYVHFTRGDLMTNRIAELLSLHGTTLLYTGTFLVAAIAGGLSSLAGFYLKEIFKQKKLITGTW